MKKNFILLISLCVSVSLRFAGPACAGIIESGYSNEASKTISGGGFSTSFSDDFNRADANPIGSPYAAVTNEFGAQIVSNAVKGDSTANNSYAVRYTSALASTDHWAEIRIKSTADFGGSGGLMAVLLRVSPSSQTYYFAKISSATLIQVARKVSGGSTYLQDITGFTLAANDRIRFSVATSGATAVLRVFINDVQKGGDVIDASPITGNAYAGFRAPKADSANSADDFSTGLLSGGTGTAVLSWNTPTTFSDGTPMTVRGYKVYYGTSPGNYTTTIDTLSTATTYTVTGLAANQTYYFAVTAYVYNYTISTAVESGATPTADNFDRADANPVAGSWSTAPGFSPMMIQNNQMRGSSSGSNAAIFTGQTFSADQYSQAVVYPASTGVDLWTRASTTAQTFYWVYVGTTWWQLGKMVNGSPTELDRQNRTTTPGTLVRLAVVGAKLTVSFDGAEVSSSVTDTAIAAGYPGVKISGATDFLDDWQGGDIAAGGTLYCPSPVMEGLSVTCIAAPIGENQTMGISGCGGSWTSGNSYPTVAISSDCTVTASFGSPFIDVTAPQVDSFSVIGEGPTVSITEFTGSDDIGVTGYLITETSSRPTATAAGWTASAPVTYTFSTGGTHALYAWLKDAAGNVSVNQFMLWIYSPSRKVRGVNNMGRTLTGIGAGGKIKQVVP